MFTKINSESPVPLYYQLKEIIVDSISKGEYGVGDLIPSENQLCKLYNVSRSTSQKALDELVNEGILIRKQGVGTFVAMPRIEQALANFYSFSDAMRARGYEHKVKVLSLSVQKATLKQAKMLNLSAEERVTLLSRMRLINGVPFLIETSCLPEKIAPGLNEVDFSVNSLYKTLMNTYRLFVVKAREMFEPVLINQSESLLLEVPQGSPAILLERVAFASNDEPIEFCRSIIPGSKCRFYTELR